MKRLLGIFSGLGLVGLFIVSFAFFLYLTFPYGVLKEAVGAVITKSTPITLRMGSLSPSLPFGIEAEDVQLRMDTGGASLKLDSAEVDISLLYLILGRLGVSAELSTGATEFLEAGLTFKIMDLINQRPIPRHLEIQADNFNMEGVNNFGLSVLSGELAKDPAMGAFVGDALREARLYGKLMGEVDLDINIDEVTASRGKIDLQLDRSGLEIGESFGIPSQVFDKFKIAASMTKGTLNFSKETGMASQELQVAFSGDIKFNPEILRSLLEMQVVVNIDGELKKALFDFGEYRKAIKGTLASPRTAPL